jgi:hypothetical protein
MRFLRTSTVLVFATLAFLLATLAACGGQAARTGAAASPSSSPSAAAAPGPATAPAPSPSSGVPSPSPSSRVVSSRVAYGWLWPNGPVPGRVTHSYPVPPVPELVSISAGEHPAGSGQPAFDRMSFTFTNAFPSYRFEFTTSLVGDGSGKVIPLTGPDVLTIAFTQARAHTADGTRSTITAQPGRPVGYRIMTDFAQAGDFEGVLTYGIGVARPILHSNPQSAVRAYEVETITANGQHRYVVAIDIAGKPL